MLTQKVTTISMRIMAPFIFKNLTSLKLKHLLSHQRNLCFGVPGLLFLLLKVPGVIQQFLIALPIFLQYRISLRIQIRCNYEAPPKDSGAFRSAKVRFYFEKGRDIYSFQMKIHMAGTQRFGYKFILILRQGRRYLAFASFRL